MENEIKYLFERGDIVSDFENDIRLILKAKNGIYQYMYLKTIEVKDIFNRIHKFEKGSKATQPSQILEKYFFIIKI